MKSTLRKCGVICIIVGLWLVVSLTARAECGYETNKFDLKAEVEVGGWTAAWADDISETDVAKGVVAAGVSVYSANPGPFLLWVEELVRRTISSLSSSMQDRFSQRVIDQANQLAAEAIKAAVKGQNANEVLRQFDTVDFKAGAVKYGGRNYCKGFNQDVTLSRTWGMKPYVAFRWRGSGGSEEVVVPQGGDSVTIQNLGNSSYRNWYLDIDGENGRVILWNSGSVSGVRWKITSTGNGSKIQNMCNCPYRGWYLDIDGDNGTVILVSNPNYSGTNWRITRNGDSVKIQNLGNSRYLNWYLDIDGRNGRVILVRSPSYSGTNWLIRER